MFKLERNMSAPNFEQYERYPTTASETYSLGEVLKLSAGKLTAADVNSSGQQLFICGCDYEAPASGQQPIPVYRIQPTMIFRVKSYANNSATAIGALVTLHTDRLQVTATTTNGVAEIVDLLGDGTAGSEIQVRFPTAAGR